MHILSIPNAQLCIHERITPWPDHQWLQFDLGPPTKVTGLVTLGQGDKKIFVTSYTVSYSNDSSLWFVYKDANHLEPKVRVPYSYMSILRKLVCRKTQHFTLTKYYLSVH
jgi:hypothetical protein